MFGANPPTHCIYNPYYTDNGIAISNVFLIQHTPISTHKIIINKEFSLPLFLPYSFIYYLSLTNDENKLIYWTCTNSFTSLQNGRTFFYYPDETNFTNHHVNIQYTSSLQQHTNISQIGLYILSFIMRQDQVIQ